MTKVAVGSTQAFTFTRTGLANSFDLSNGGSNDSGHTLTPGSYTVCELNLAVAWNTTATIQVNDGAATPLTLTNPGASQTPSEDFGTRCGTFTIAYAQTVTVIFTNTPPPGGTARTIGYWKNWSSCSQSNGGQYTKAVARGDFDRTLDGNLPQTIGILVLPATAAGCADAVDILNKSRIDTGRKMASDPAFNLAAQLLAAQLNFRSGAYQCPEAVTVAALAQAALVELEFDGIRHKPISKTLAATLNGYATTLDKYNHNTLCVIP